MSKKLSDTQKRMIMAIGTSPSEQMAVSSMSTRILTTLGALKNREIPLVKREMTSNVRFSFWMLTEAGRDVFIVLTAPSVIVIDPIEAPAEDETLASELPAVEPEITCLTGTVTQRGPFGVYITSDEGKTVKVDRRQIYGLALGMRVEYQMGKSEAPIMDVAQHVKPIVMAELPAMSEAVSTKEIEMIEETTEQKIISNLSPMERQIMTQTEVKCLLNNDGKARDKAIIRLVGKKLLSMQRIGSVMGSAYQLTDLGREINMILFHAKQAKKEAIRKARDEDNDNAPIPTTQTSLIAAKDDHIRQLEARVAELEARLSKIDQAYDECAKVSEDGNIGPKEGYERAWGVRLERLFVAVATSAEGDELPFEEERSTYHNDLNLGGR